MDCNIWAWDWAICDDIPSWMTFVLGAVLASAFFGWQLNLRRKRRENAEESFVLGLQLVTKNIEFLEKTIEAYYTNGETEEYKNIVIISDGTLKRTGQHLRFILGISGDTMKKNVFRNLDYYVALLEQDPITGNKENDLDRIAYVKGGSKRLLEGQLKEARILSDANIHKLIQDGLKDSSRNKGFKQKLQFWKR